MICPAAVFACSWSAPTLPARADLLLINGDPEKDIRQVRQMEIVFKHGVGFDSAKLLELRKEKLGLN